MSHKYGVSGSTILSDPNRFEELFWKDIDLIEIGEFPDEAAFQAFSELRKEKEVPFGVHSPLFRSGSKYDLIQKVNVEPENAWESLEREAERLSRLGAEYILVHFPYFLNEDKKENVNFLIERGLQRLSLLQEKYSIPFICEPKLGPKKSPIGIDYLDQFPEKLWAKYSIKLCIDIGDYLLATGDQILTYLKKWKKHIGVVHLHNVAFQNNRYIWIPVHPSHETNGTQYKIEHIIKFLKQCEKVNFIFEHTPHSNPKKEFVQGGYEWIKTL
ncbi:hypothetical protein GCM10008967_27950 [Bacillus carboniphilus]|uniref:Xylose isomerase-like TIM barrel domain-containing protein n=1 Tax=Bacillus carboniphilus TaxID=86663 RepID=A0ABN0WFV9_9BACI